MIADKYDLLYQNSSMTYEKAMEMLIGDNKTTDFEMLGEFVQSNFLKVNLTFCSKVRSCYRVKPGGPKKFLLEVKTITKSPGNGIA